MSLKRVFRPAAVWFPLEFSTEQPLWQAAVSHPGHVVCQPSMLGSPGAGTGQSSRSRGLSAQHAWVPCGGATDTVDLCSSRVRNVLQTSDPEHLAENEEENMTELLAWHACCSLYTFHRHTAEDQH
eukprot:TRINITY_DN18224_c1_g1_i2.p1 TRINITY_DN18224_c1_g1~~TRINITY_DN18224_c1_g1_i2.p1  ORF type:complete len:126 (+),score=14.03 TRINITY_DN18224_c1_g1_i2:282-659(+)